LTTDTVATTGLRIAPSGRALGADVEGLDMTRPLTDSALEAIQAAWDEHLVLRVRGQREMTLDQFVAFSRRFGELDKRPIASGEMSRALAELPPEITVISNVKQDGKPIGGLGDAESVWHADMTYNERPPKAACLFAVEIPPSGGNTYFANMYLAYETLPPDLKERAETLRCVHDASRNSAGELRNGFVDNDDPRKTVGAVHPLVRTHPRTGRKCLLLGRRRGAYLVGLPLEESEALLNQLWAHATAAHLTWGQEWRLGDVVMWDNTCTMHRRDAFDPSTRRLMYRTQIAGGPVY
jgi:taurine dioxygenase